MRLEKHMKRLGCNHLITHLKINKWEKSLLQEVKIELWEVL